MTLIFVAPLTDFSKELAMATTQASSQARSFGTLLACCRLGSRGAAAADGGLRWEVSVVSRVLAGPCRVAGANDVGCWVAGK